MPAASPDLLSVFGALPGAYLLLSPSLVIEAASDDYLTATLTERAGLLGKYVFDVFPDNPQNPGAQAVHTVHTSLAQVLATGQPHELPLVPYDLPDPARPGQFVPRYWHTRNAPVLDEQGRIVHLIHAIVDVTDKVQAATQLRESQLREQAATAEVQHQRSELNRIFEQAPVAIAAYRGPNYVIELANPMVCALWGRTQAQALGTPLFELLPEIVGQGFEELLDQVSATGVPYEAKEMASTIDRNGGLDMVYWNFVYLPLREDDGCITGVMVVATEVSEQVKARQQIQDLNNQLAVANQALHVSNGELLANQEEVLQVQQLLEGRIAERTQQLEAALAKAREPNHTAQMDQSEAK